MHTMVSREDAMVFVLPWVWVKHNLIDTKNRDKAKEKMFIFKSIIVKRLLLRTRPSHDVHKKFFFLKRYDRQASFVI